MTTYGLRDWWRECSDAGAPLPYLLVDCAGLEGGHEALPSSEFSEMECLFTGDLADELNDVGGWLVRLRSWDDSTLAVAEDLMQRELAVLMALPMPDDETHGMAQAAAAEPSFAQVHRHLRKFNVVYGPNGQPLFWRYYDPRVLPSVLGVLDAAQVRSFLGPFAGAWVMDAEGQLSGLQAPVEDQLEA